MAKKGFNRDEVLDNAIALFWQHGYTASSMQLISKYTGLKPGSLYNEFNSKEGLFRAALERYAEKSAKDLHVKFKSTEDVKNTISTILQHLITETENTDYCGCFLIKTQLELAAQQNQLYQLASDNLKETEKIYQQYLAQVYPQETATDYARQLMMTIFGLRVYGYQKNQQSNITQTVTNLLPWLAQ